MGAGYGIGPAREQIMIEVLSTWGRHNGKLRPTEVGGVDIVRTVAHLNRSVREGTETDRQVIQAHRYLCFFVQELNEVLNEK